MNKPLEEKVLYPWLEALRQQDVRRSPEQAQAGRERFLDQAKSLGTPVSWRSNHRHKGWNSISIPLRRRKELNPMVSVIAAILVIASLVLGGGGVTLAAAQYSLPDQPLYGIKLASENARLSLAQGEPLQQAELSVQFALRRLEEIQAMLQQGQTPAEPLMERARKQLEQALHLVANLPDEQANRQLERICTRLQEMLQSHFQLPEQANPTAQQALERVRQMLQTRLLLLEECSGDLQQLRLRLQTQTQTQEPQNTPGQRNPTPGNPTPGSGGNHLPDTGSGNPIPGGSGSPAPDTGMGNPVPGSNGYPAPVTGDGNQAPGGGSNPNPGTGDGNPAPGTGDGNPAPGSGDHPAPGSGGSNPIPGSGGTIPGPGSGGVNPEPGSGGSNPDLGNSGSYQYPGSGGSSGSGSGGKKP